MGERVESFEGAVPTRFWHRLDDGRTQCDVCPRFCKLRPGQRGLCFVRAANEAGEIVLTSMDCDGTKDGYDLEITRAVSEAVGIPVVASGGAGKPEHLADAIQFGKADAALADAVDQVLSELGGYSARARARAVERFALEPWLERHAELFERLAPR